MFGTLAGNEVSWHSQPDSSKRGEENGAGRGNGAAEGTLGCQKNWALLGVGAGEAQFLTVTSEAAFRLPR